MKKTCISLFLLVALLLTLAPWAAADEGASSPTPPALVGAGDAVPPADAEGGAVPEADDLPKIGTMYTFTAADDLFPQSGDALLNAYVQEMFRSGDPDHLTFPQSKRLPDPSQVLGSRALSMESALKTVIQAIARGDRTSTEIEFRLKDLELDDWDVRHMDMNAVLKTLILDCTYELYWFGRQVAWGLTSSEKVLFQFLVSDDCAADSAHLRVKSEAVRAAKNAVKNTAAIISANAGLSDVEKLRAYKNEICRLTEYNHDAADTDAFLGKEGPWNLVWVFDEDPATNVVCEGYAKAFEYLCNQSTFKSNLVNCFCATGEARFPGAGTGPHMWNIVSMEDGRNYVIDVTNCDIGTTGNNDFFLTCALEGTPREGYALSNGSVFLYDGTTLAATTDKSRTLATSPFQGAPGNVSITVHPETQRVAEGQPVTFTASATGTGLRYQWYCLSSMSQGWQQVAGATEASLTMVTEEAMDCNVYFCQVTGSSGCRASESAILEVAVKPVITLQPADITVVNGEKTLLKVEVKGNYLTYQWYSRKHADEEWTTVSSSDSSEATTDQASIYEPWTHPDNDLCQYYCKVSNGPWTVDSDVATLTVISRPMRDPGRYLKTVEVVAGTPAVFQVFMEPNRFLAYQWYRIVDGQQVPIEGATTDTYTITATLEMDGDRYMCRVSNAAGEWEEYAYLYIITEPPIITKQPQDYLAPAGQIGLHIEAEGRGLSYQWYCYDGKTEYALEGAIYDTYAFPAGEEADGNQYWCVISNALGTVTSRRMTYRVLYPPVIEEEPQDVCLPHDATSATFTISVRGEQLEYEWIEYDLSYFDHIPDSNRPSITVPITLKSDGYWYRCIVTNSAGRVESRTATVTFQHVPGEPVKENEVPATSTSEGSYDEVRYCTICHKQLSWKHVITEKLPAEPPTIKTQPKNASVKSGAKAKFTVKVKEKHVTYQWFSKAPGAADWAELPGETKGTLTVVATKANSGTQYRCRVRTAEGGEADTIAATLTVKIQPPVIKTQPKNLAVVSGKKAKFAVKASGPKLTYTWYSRPNAEAAWTPVAGQTKSSLSIVASKANDGSQYYCHIQNADGEVESAVVTLTVTPQPPTIKAQPKDAKVKIGAKAKFKVKATG